MADPMYEPRSIQVLGDGMEVLWKDGHRSLLAHRYLRGNCGCAQCVDELTHRRRVSIAETDPDVRVEDFMEVGHYAIALLFSDLHATGIYPFTLLRKLCPCPECQLLRQAEAASQAPPPPRPASP